MTDLAVAHLETAGFAGRIVRTRPTPLLVSRHADGLLVGWLAVALWVAAALAHHARHRFSLAGPWVVWPATVITATHFVISYRLAYTGRRSLVRVRPVALVLVPSMLVLTAVCTGVIAAVRGGRSVAWMTSLLVSTVFVSSGFHYIKQAYGVVRLSASFNGIRLEKPETRVLRYGIYPAWILGLRSLAWMGRLPGDLASRTFQIVRLTAWLGAGAIIWVLVRIWRRTSVVPPSTMVAPYGAAILWMVFPMNLSGAGMILAALHGVQYLACCHRAEMTRPERRRPEGPLYEVRVPVDRQRRTREVRHRIVVFGTSGAIGILLVNSIPNLLDRWIPVSGTTGLFPLLFFVTLNLTHYVIDAVIWRSDGPVVRSMTRVARPTG